MTDVSLIEDTDEIDLYRQGNCIDDIRKILNKKYVDVRDILANHFAKQENVHPRMISIKKSLLLKDDVFMESLKKLTCAGYSDQYISNELNIGILTILPAIRVFREQASIIRIRKEKYQISKDKQWDLALIDNGRRDTKRKNRQNAHIKNLEIVERVKNGETFHNIGHNLGLSRERIRQFCRAAIIDDKEWDAIVATSNKARIAKRIAEFKQFVTDGLLDVDIAEKTGWRLNTVKMRAKRNLTETEFYNWHNKCKKVKAERSPKIVNKEHEKIVENFIDGMSYNEIARITKRSIGGVVGIVGRSLSKEERQNVISTRPGKHIIDPDIVSEIVNRLRNNESRIKISKEFDISMYHIQKICDSNISEEEKSSIRSENVSATKRSNNYVIVDEAMSDVNNKNTSIAIKKIRKEDGTESIIIIKYVDGKKSKSKHFDEEMLYQVLHRAEETMHNM